VDGAAVVVRLAGDPVFGEVADGSGVGLLSAAVVDGPANGGLELPAAVVDGPVVIGRELPAAVVDGPVVVGGELPGAVAGSVVLASGGNPVTVALTPMLKLVAVGEPGTVGVVRGGVEG